MSISDLNYLNISNKYKIVKFALELHKQYEQNPTVEFKKMYTEFVDILREDELEIYKKYKDKPIEEFYSVINLL